MSICSLWNSFTRQQQKETFHNFAAQAPWLRHCASPLESFSKISHLFPNEHSQTYSTLVRRLPKWMPQGIKPSPEASISSGVAHFRMTHLNWREVVMNQEIFQVWNFDAPDMNSACKRTWLMLFSTKHAIQHLLFFCDMKFEKRTDSYLWFCEV